MPDRNHQSRGQLTGSAIGLLIAIALVLIVAPAAWWTTDALEADNDFCNSCHLPDGTPLHKGIRDGFDARPAASLAASHAATSQPNRPDSPSIRCIDCHGGIGLLGRGRIKLLSAKDTILYLTGYFNEPETMSWPLMDVDCRQCHADFREKEDGFDGEAFHNKPLHNVDLGVDCVECHSVHDAEAEADPGRWFLQVEHVRARCAQCHVEYAEP